jgi:alkyl hydroperoxide reductase subunit AhpC
VAKLSEEWKSRNVRVLALSVDTRSEHDKWIPDIDDIGQCNVNYPIVADHDRKVSDVRHTFCHSTSHSALFFILVRCHIYMVC